MPLPRFVAATLDVAHGTAADVGLLIIRAGFGGYLSLNHGLGKLESWPAKHDSFADPLNVGHATSLALTILGEFVCGLLIALGLGTRLAAIPAIITMLVAAFLVHKGDILGDGEHAMLYALAFAAVAAAGPGRFSLDAVLGKRFR